MSNIQNGLSSLLQSYRQIQARTAESMKILGSGKRITHPKVDPAAWRDMASHSAQAEKIRGFSENLSTAGVSTRVALSAMDATQKHVDLLDQKLAAAAAAPAGSHEREVNLTEFNRVIDVMEDLADPPDPGARRLLGNPDSVSDAGDITVKAGADFSFTLRHQPIYLGEGGLDLTSFATPGETSTEEIEAAAADIAAARELLTTKRQVLVIDSSAIARSEAFNTQAADQSLTRAERLDSPDLSREAALMQSMSVRSSIAIHGLTSLNQSHLQALQLLP